MGGCAAADAGAGLAGRQGRATRGLLPPLDARCDPLPGRGRDLLACDARGLLVAEFHDRLRGRVREREGRHAEPSAGIIDAQSVRASASVPASSSGYDGGKKVPARAPATGGRSAYRRKITPAGNPFDSHVP